MNKILWLSIFLLGCADGSAQDRENKIVDEAHQNEKKPSVMNDGEIDLKKQIMLSDSPETIQERQQENSKIYLKQLKSAPIYTSEIRSYLIENTNSHGRFRLRIDNFIGLEHEFHCIHDPIMIQRAELDGWQLVKCTQNRAIFFRKIEDRFPQCEERPKVSELYHTLEFTVRNAWYPVANPVNLSADEYIEKTRKRLGIDFERPTRFEVPFDHPQVKKFYAEMSEDKLEYIIPTIQWSDEIVLRDLTKLQSVFFRDTTNKRCERNAKGWQYTGQGYFVLDTPSSSFQEMSKQLLRFKTYAR